MSGEVPLGGGGEVPRGGIEEVLGGMEDIDLEGMEDVDFERSTKASFGRVEVDLERSVVDFERSDDSFDRVEVDFEPSNDSFDRAVIVDFEKSAPSFLLSNMKVPAVEVFTKSGETEAGLVRAVVIVIEEEVLMDVIALKEDDALKDVVTEYKLPEVLAVEMMDEEGSRPPFVSPTGSAADSPSLEGILDCVGFLGPGNAPKIGDGGSSSKGGLFEANACL